MLTVLFVQNYKDLGTRVNSFKDKLQQHLRDLERAQSTATSDPTADADITEAGDMEIESESDAEDLIEPPPVLPSSSIMTVGQASSHGVMGQTLMSVSSTPAQLHMMSSISSQPLMAVSAASAVQQPYTAPQNSNFYPSNIPNFSGPQIPTAANYPPRFRPPPMQRPPRMPPSRPPPYRHSVHLPPSPVPASTRIGVSIPPPSQVLERAPPILPPSKPDAKPMATTPYPMAMSAMALSSANSSPLVVVGDPVSYKKENSDEENSDTDAKTSIDERLENLQKSTKLFKMSTTNDNGSNSDDKTYNDDNELFTNFSENRNERYSPEEASPKLNMDNPILQALYSSPQPPPAAAHTSSNTGQSLTTMMEAGSKPPTSMDASQIKITPALTTLLDQLLPSLSKSLQMDRKRENNSSPDIPSSKIPRMNSDQAGPGAVHSKPAHDVPPWIRDQQYQKQQPHDVPPWIRDQQYQKQQPHFDQQQHHFDQQQKQHYDDQQNYDQQHYGDFSPQFRPRYPSPGQRFDRLRVGMRMPSSRPRGAPRFRARPPHPPDGHRAGDGYQRPRQQSRGRYGPEFDRRSTYS